MRVYLVGNKGGRTAFKITTAKVVTNIDYVLDDMFKDASTATWYGETSIVNIIYSRSGWGYNIYYTELDERSQTAKKLTGKVWKEVIDEYVKSNKDKVIELNNQYKQALKERGEE